MPRLTHFRAGRAALAVCFVWLLPSSPAQAQQSQRIVFTLDPARTRVEFTLDAFLHTVHGTANLTEGSVEVDIATGEAGGRIVADARSARTGNDGRDNKMHKEILESGKYPAIVFTPRQIEGQLALEGRSEVRLRGLLAVHGTGHEITVPVSVQVTANNWTGEATFAAPYAQWGLKNPSTFFLRVKDTVTVTIHAAGTLSM